jgi:hypothetical protein
MVTLFFPWLGRYVVKILSVNIKATAIHWAGKQGQENRDTHYFPGNENGGCPCFHLAFSDANIKDSFAW